MMGSMFSPSAIHHAVVLKVMNEQLQKLYNKSSNRYKLSLLYRLENQSSQRIREDLSLVDRVVESIIRNSGNGNLKRAFHFLIVLEQLIERIQTQIDSLNLVASLAK